MGEALSHLKKKEEKKLEKEMHINHLNYLASWHSSTWHIRVHGTHSNTAEADAEDRTSVRYIVISTSGAETGDENMISSEELDPFKARVLIS